MARLLACVLQSCFMLNPSPSPITRDACSQHAAIALQGCKELRLSKEEASNLESLQTWLWKLQRDSSTDDEEFLDDNSKAYLHSFRDNFTRYSLFLVWSHAMLHCPSFMQDSLPKSVQPRGCICQKEGEQGSRE